MRCHPCLQRNDRGFTSEMANQSFMETAKQLRGDMSALLERISASQSGIGSLLSSAKAAEKALKEKEQKAERERKEKEREERLREMLASDKDLAVHVGGEDETPEPALEEPAKPEDTAAEKAAEEKPAKEAPAAAETPKAEAKPEEKPAVRTAGGYEARTISQPSGQGRREQPRSQSGDRRDTRPERPGQAGQQARQGSRPGNDARPSGQRPMGKPGTQAAASPVPAKEGKDRQDGKQQDRRSGYDDKKARNKKSIQKENGPTARNWEDDGVVNNRKAKRGKQQQPVQKPAPVVIDKAVITTEMISVKDLSEKIGKPVAEIIKKLFMLGIMATINQEIDFDTCELICSEYGIEVEQKLAKSFEEVLSDAAAETDAPEELVERPPVVTIMGHVDHGKTSLLDAIRNSSITSGEAGGITQHIGAYTVQLKGRKITFIDTPGHEAFTAMRARGAQVTDVVILVVAADDGIMPQTIEAINHAKAANVPIVVAINKMDRPNADPERIKQQLTEHGLLCEDWGGETICVPVSAKTQMNLDTLLEMVLLQADVLELKANPKRMAKGTIVEAKLDKGRGPIATVLVQNGTLHKGDAIIAGMAYGRVRAMVDDRGRTVNEAGPSMAVEVLGFNEVPEAGDTLNAVEADKLTRQVVEERRDKQKAAQVKAAQKVSLDDLFSQMAEGDLKELNLVIKADVQGSVEAVKQSLEKLSNDEVRVKCIHGAVGAITSSDVMFAAASNAIIIGFNVRPEPQAKADAAKENVDIRTYRIIYNAIEDIEAAMKGMFKPVFKETELGHAEVRSTFRISGVGMIAGAYVQDGKVTRNAQVRIVRDGIVIHEGKIASLKRFKDDVKEVASGYECGIGIENFYDIQVGDTMEAFVMEQVER